MGRARTCRPLAAGELKAYMSRGLQGGNPLKLLGNLGRMIGRPCDVRMANSSLLQVCKLEPSLCLQPCASLGLWAASLACCAREWCMQ